MGRNNMLQNRTEFLETSSQIHDIKIAEIKNGIKKLVVKTNNLKWVMPGLGVCFVLIAVCLYLITNLYNRVRKVSNQSTITRSLLNYNELRRDDEQRDTFPDDGVL